MAKQILIKDSKLKDLKPDPDNPRTISEEKLSSLRKSLEEFGDLSCIVYNELEDKLVGAHQRLKVFNPNSKIVITDKYKKPNRQGTIREGYVLIDGEKFKYRVVRWTKEKHKAAMLAANKHSGDWVQKKLEEIVESLKGSSLDFGLTGFQFADFPKIFPEENKKGLVDDDFVPEPKKTNIKLGDIFELGDHRLMCGDSTNKNNLEILIKDKPVLVVTDPPYGISVVKNKKVGADFGVAKKGKYKEILGDNNIGIAKQFIKICQEYGIKKFIIWGGNYFTEILPATNSWIVWNKRGDTKIKNTFSDGELAWSNLGFPVRIHNQLWNGMIREGEKDARVHPTQKPINLLEFCINQDKSLSNIFDGFGGSGSTLIACEKTNRKCYMMELDPYYCQVIIDRWEAYTGRKAVKVSN